MADGAAFVAGDQGGGLGQGGPAFVASVPQDVAVAGFDDLPQAATSDPPLTTMRQDERQLGREAARTLFALLKDPNSRPQRVILPTELLIRASTVPSPK